MGEEGVPLEVIQRSNPAYVRQEIGNLTSLKRSMSKYGLVLPILTTPDYLIVDGARRFEAAFQLGWADIPTLATENWWTIKEHFIKARQLEAEGWPSEKMRWLEYDDLDRRILRRLYQRVRWSRDRNKGLDKVARSNYVNDLAEMWNMPGNHVEAIKEMGATINKASPELASKIIEIINEEENSQRRIYSAKAAAEKSLVLGIASPTIANQKIATEQAAKIEAALDILAHLSREFGFIGEINPAMPYDVAMRLVNSYRRSMKKITPLRKKLDLQRFRAQEREEALNEQQP